MANNITKAYGKYNENASIPEKIRLFFYGKMIKKIIKKIYNKKKHLHVLDIGCGYYATNLQNINQYIDLGVGVDLEISEEISLNKKITPIIKPYNEALQNFKDEEFDVILIISVLEHLTDPLYCLKESHRILKNDGILIINVPTWHSKPLLEFLAFKLRVNDEHFFSINDHKMYYNKQDLWKILVQSGFEPRQINMRYHKFWLALLCSCNKNSYVIG